MNIIEFENILHPLVWLVRDKPEMEQVWSLAIDMLDNPTIYDTIIAKNMKVKDLKKAIPYSLYTKKAELVSEFRVVSVRRLSRVRSLTYNLNKGSFEEALRQHIDEMFVPDVWRREMAELEADFLAEQKRAKERMDGLDNPQTLRDFKNIECLRGIESLNEEQLARYDALKSENYVLQRRRNVQLYANRLCIDLEGIAFDLIDTQHTRKLHDLYVVQFSEWLPRRLWKQVYERAREFGGWYSGYDRDDAVPGIQFKDEKQRTLYCESVLCGGAQLAEHIEYARHLATLSASYRLWSLAFRITRKEEAELEQAKLRLANTPRRARMQATAIARCNKKKALARTMEAVAEVIEKNPDHILAGIRYRTDFETLSVVGMDWPSYEVSEEIAHNLLEQAHIKEGKLAAKMIQKRIRTRRTTKIYFCDKIVEQLMNKGVEAWWLFEQYTHRARLNRMNLLTIPELRHAQRELARLRVEPESEPEWVEIERSLIGMRIPGFFPTPPALIRAMCDAVDLKDTDRVLDPSCGKGDILSYVCEHHNVEKAVGMEINSKLADLCRIKGWKVWNKDALDEKLGYSYASVILMNPPFESGAAIRHFTHAFNNAEPDTRLACILPASVQTNRDVETQAFRSLIEYHGGEITHNPEGAFESAFCPTSINTVMLVITK